MREILRARPRSLAAHVHLPSFRAHATECAAGPWFTRRAHEEFFFLAMFEKSAIGRGQVERLGCRIQPEREQEQAKTS